MMRPVLVTLCALLLIGTNYSSYLLGMRSSRAAMKMDWTVATSSGATSVPLPQSTPQPTSQSTSAAHSTSAAKIASRAAPLEDDATKRRFTTFQCTASSQILPWMLEPWKNITYNSKEHRVCEFENLCWWDGEFRAFMDPAKYEQENFPNHLLLESFGRRKLTRGGYWDYSFTPVVKYEAIPTNGTLWGNRSLYLMDSVSFTYNVGHYLLDNVAPQFFAMDMFDQLGNIDDAQVLLREGCYRNTENKFNGTLCNVIYNSTWDFWWNYPVIPLRDGPGITSVPNTCFRRILLGQTSAFNLMELQPARGGAMRRLRDRTREKGIAKTTVGPTPHHRILVLLKQDGFTKAALHTLCNDVKQAVALLNLSSPQPEVVCRKPGEFPLREQWSWAANFHIIISEHGTTSFGALFARDKSVLIQVAPAGHYLKSVAIMLYVTHIKVQSLNWAERDKLPGHIWAAMYDTSQHFAQLAVPKRSKSFKV